MGYPLVFCVQLSADLSRAGIGQGKFAAEQHERRRQHDHGQHSHHQAQTQQGRSALRRNGAGLVGVSGKANEVEPDAGQKHCHTGRGLDDESLH